MCALLLIIFSPLISFLKDYFLRAVLGLQQNLKGGTEISYIGSSPAPHTHSSPIFSLLKSSMPFSKGEY